MARGTVAVLLLNIGEGNDVVNIGRLFKAMQSNKFNNNNNKEQ